MTRHSLSPSSSSKKKENFVITVLDNGRAGEHGGQLGNKMVGVSPDGGVASKLILPTEQQSTKRGFLVSQGT